MRSMSLATVGLIVASLLSCDPGNYPPRPATGPLKFCQGDWDFDEGATLADMRVTAKSLDDVVRMERMVSQLRALGVPLHSDITVSGNTIVGRGSLLQPQYEVLSTKVVDGKTIATVRWHEDRNDPGDMSNITMTIWRTETHLVFSLTEEGQDGTPYYFIRPGSKKVE